MAFCYFSKLVIGGKGEFRIKMGCSIGDEGIAILQLRKWCPSQFPFDLSEFREAFISPTKELLLLLSYHCEALLFPLIPGDSVDCNNVENCYDGSLQDPCSSSLSRSDSKDDAPCTSGSVVDFDNGFSHERNFSRSNSYSFVSDVNSLAWGVCADTYNQHKDTSFRELLFVSGDQCVTVHAFRHPSDISSKARHAMQDNFGQGRWVEWGPSSTLVHSVEVEESSSLFCEAPGDADDEYITNGNRENSHDMHMEARDDESLRGVGSKRWLRSFYTKAETIKSDGGFWTRFPEESSFPESAKVVSFTIFDSNLSNLEIPANGNSVSLKEDRQENVLDLKKDVPTNSHLASSSLNFQSDVLPDLLGIDNNISFKCTRVFSRNSHDLLGFLLALVDPLSVSVRDGSERNRSKHAVLVSRLSSWGIQWVSAVKLEESLNGGSMIEWTDFCFTDELLVCLSSSGFIFFYAAMSGDYVAKLDIPSTYGLSLCSSLQEQEKLSTAADMQVKQEDEVCGTPTCHQHGHFDGRMFKKLIAASHTTLLAVVDEYSVIYVIGGGDDILEKYSTSTKLLAHSSQLGLGMLVGWGAGGSDIGHQRVHSCFSSSHNHGFNQIFHGKGRRKDIFLNGFSAASKTNDQTSCDSEAQLHLLRKIFLPTDRYAEDDCICFSSLGITRLAKKHHTKEQNGAKVVHFDLHMSSAVHDDSFLNPGLETFSLKGRKESSVVEAVGCTFQGCFYLVTEGGLSVVLPAISVSPNFLPIETIGYRQACINTGVGSQIKSNLEMEEFKQPWSPWKVEILDRVLLYEGPEEADRLCLENGWELKISRMRRLQMALEYMKFDEIKKIKQCVFIMVQEESEEALRLVDPNLPQDESQLSIVAADVGLLDTVNQREIPFTLSEAAASDVENLALMPHSSLSSKAVLELEDSGETSLPVPQGAALRRKVLPLENPKEMIARWKIDKLDLKTVVKDALLSGRLPLAVLQLHLNHSTEFSSEEEHHDTFTEVRDIGRAIAYDLFLKLVFGTVRRSLRMQIAEEMRKYGYLGSYEWKMLERMSLLQCGEVDGVVLGSWTNVNESSSNPVIDEENAHIGYWVAAAVWSNVWDQRTIDRIVLDQPFHMGVHVLWESQLEYHICHNDWEEVSKLLEFIPASVLSEGSLQIALDVLQPATVGCNSELPDFGNYICSIEDLDAVCLDVPKIKVFRFSANGICSTWLRMLMEQELAKKFVFLKEYWEGTGEIVSLLARSGFIMNRNKMSPEDDSIESFSDLNLSNIGRSTVDTLHALHKLLVHHCAEHNLPNLLDLYLDHHKLVQDNDLLCSLQEAAGNCHWARWLLFSRVKGHEYDAAFSNARSTMSHSLVSGSNLSVPEIDDIIRTVDDIAEGGGEMAALATLMYAPAPIQNCLSSGSIRHSSSSAQCTLENLRPTLQRFPTLWRTLVAACFGEEPRCNFLGPKAKNDLSDYLNWRDSIFFSSGRDTSLSQILPCWFPKAVRRLIQLYVQGPLGWQSPSGLPTETLLQGDVDFFTFADGDAEVSAISWEATIQKHIEEELYDASLKETGIGLEHHLHRGRALAAFNQLLGVRIEKMKSEGRSSSSALGLANVQSDVQTLLAPIIKNEEFLLSSVMPLAISHFEDSVLVASCTFFLELCGLSASLLRVDVSALRRISSFYKSSENAESYKQLSPKSSAFYALPHEGDITKSLARALADEYLQEGSATKAKQKGSPSSVASARPSRALLLVLQHLEKASLPVLLDGKTCGSWLLTGNGDGTELRSQQKAASQHWDLVTVFCQMHQLPLSTKYLAVLARDNDWVNDIASQIADNVAAAVKATNAIPADGRALTFHYNRQSPKRRRLIEPISADPLVVSSDVSISYPSSTVVIAQGSTGEEGKKKVNQCLNFQSDSVEGSASLSKMVAVLCEQHLFLPLLRAFEMFLPSCSFLPFIRALQAESLVAEWKEFLWDVPEERVALWSHCQTLVYPLHLLREIETRVWLLAVESEAQVKSEGDFSLINSTRENSSNIIDQTANIITKMDNHINTMRKRIVEKHDLRENNQAHFKSQFLDVSSSTTAGGSSKTKRRAKGFVSSRRQLTDSVDRSTDSEDSSGPPNSRNDSLLPDESSMVEMSFPKWEERVEPAELERAVLSLLEVGQITAAKQLQHKLFPAHIPSEFILVDTALKLASLSTPSSEVSISILDEEVLSVLQSCNIPLERQLINPLQGLLAAHRGGYMDSQKEEGPAPLLWRFSDFLKWAELCPSEPEIGHALMRLVITGQEIPHACEVELLILCHHFYKSSACLDGVDVLVALAATRVEAYVYEGDFPCLARLITGVGNFHALNFILGILIENGQLDLLLQKYSAAADTNTGTAEAVRGFRMAVLTSLKHFNSNDLDAFAMVYNHFDMKHETAALLESRAEQSSRQWFYRVDKDQNEDLLESMRYFIEAAEVHSSIDAGNKTRRACAQASLVSLQIRMPDSKWLNLSETNARRALVEQSRFQEALIVAEAYGLNQPGEWALVLWNQMLNPERTEEFVAEFVAVLPLQPSMLGELAKFYRAEVAARGDQSQFSVWLTGGGLPAEWAKYLGRSFRCLLKRTRDLRLRLQLATVATGFNDVVNACSKALDRVPENAGPLVLRRGHGGAYLPLILGSMTSQRKVKFPLNELCSEVMSIL
ncbi:hypothetical protein CUMW_188900 [Citrus unshiu]|nr:hypothetical protein CUMW_188900 [Citrus unshiu]